jgi:anti-sigma factor RsiW
MNLDSGIRLQAYLDGELAGREAREVAAWIETDSEARAMLAELQETKELLHANEPELRLPESREFYWSKIERDITRLESTPSASRSPGWFQFARRHISALTGTSVAAALVLFVAFQMNWVSRDLFEEIENPLEDSGSFSFRSESQKMTLVWVSDASATPASSELSDPAEDPQ